MRLSGNSVSGSFAVGVRPFSNALWKKVLSSVASVESLISSKHGQLSVSMVVSVVVEIILVLFIIWVTVDKAIY